MESQQSQEVLLQDSFSKSVTSKNQIKPVLLPITRNVTCIAIYHNTLYLGSKDSKVFTYQIYLAEQSISVVQLKNQKSFYPHCDSVHFICVSELFIIVVPLAQQQLIRIWSRQNLQILHGYKGHEKQISKVIFLQDKKHIASASHDGSVRIWVISQNFQFDTEEVKFTNKYPLLALQQIDEESVTFGGDDCFISIWNWKKNYICNKLFAHAGSVSCLAHYSPRLVSMGGDSKLKIWQVGHPSPEQSSKSQSQFPNQNIENKYLVLSKIKEINVNLAQQLFSQKISNQQLLAIDSRGNMLILDSSLTNCDKKIPLIYSQRINSILVWRKLIFFVSNNSKGKGQLKFIDLTKDYKRTEKPCVVETTVVDVKQINKISLQVEIFQQKKNNQREYLNKSLVGQSIAQIKQEKQ